VLKTLNIKNFTVFQQASFSFAPGLNVIIGENGTGKSHLLKLIYAVLATTIEEGKKPHKESPTKSLLQTRLADKLVNIFRPEQLGRLARRKQGRERCEINSTFDNKKLDMVFSFATQSKSEVIIDKLPKQWPEASAVYLPTRELLTLYPGFVSVYDNHYLEFEEIYRDTCVLLGAPAVKGAREKRVGELVAPLEQAMGGKVLLDKNGRFYLQLPGLGKMEMPLVAEGLRKLAMVSRLIATGSLLDKGYLFWDEPETNLNPYLIRVVAETILHLVQYGIQVFIATHSLFLLRELEIISAEQSSSHRQNRFFALADSEQGVVVQQSDSIEDIDPIMVLDESLKQSDRFMSVG